MLLTIMSNLGMFGSSPTPSPGDGGDGVRRGGRHHDDDKEKKERERRKKILEDDDEVIDIIKLWATQINNN